MASVSDLLPQPVVPVSFSGMVNGWEGSHHTGKRVEAEVGCVIPAFERKFERPQSARTKKERREPWNSEVDDELCSSGLDDFEELVPGTAKAARLCEDVGVELSGLPAMR